VTGGTQYVERDDRPIAFLASGPQGPMYAGFNTGFQTTSFVKVDRPFMFITGVGDETGEPIPTRVTGWITSIPGNKALVWDTEPGAVHETKDINKCDTPVQQNHCRWLASAGVAFLDAVVRERPEARDWLASNALNVLSGGAIELHRR
jgi:predicted dienelactone hydrolase